jgi:hypothetical protein
MSDPDESTSTGSVPLSSTFLEFCAKVRKDDPSILPEPDKPLQIRHLSEKEGVELADAVLENTNITSLELITEKYTTGFAEAMANYLRTSKRLQRLCFCWIMNHRTLKQHEERLCCFLRAIQESTSLKELVMGSAPVGEASNLALVKMLTHTKSLQSLSLCVRNGTEKLDMAAVRSGLKKNTTLRELTLNFPRDATEITLTLTSLSDHPLLRRLCMCGQALDLTGLDILLLSDNSKISELQIHRPYGYGAGPPIHMF